MERKRIKREINVGDKITVQGYTFKVAQVISCGYWGDKPEELSYNEHGYPVIDWGFYCEFKDEKGRYHYWKQMLDGGYVTE